MAELVDEFPPGGNMLDKLENISYLFYPGDVGEVVLPLDRELATTSEKKNILAAVAELERELESEGMSPPRNRPLAELDWPARKVRIHFVAPDEPAAHVVEPSYFLVAGGIAAAAVRVAPLAAKNSFIRGFVGRVVSALNAGAIFVLIRSALLKLKGVPFFKRLFSFSSLVIGGALIWAMIDPNSLIEVFKTAARYVGKAAAGIAAGVAGGLLEGSGILIVGAIAVGAGIIMLTRRG
jgi:hypothetical protein